MSVAQSLIRTVYPPQCVSCGALTDSDFALCGTCWRDAHFIAGVTCDQCGTPLPGEDRGEQVLCDDCLTVARPWDRGRCVVRYRDKGRDLVLQIKHADRTDLARPIGTWMAVAARPLLSDDSIIVPVPLHWTRLLRRRYNQAALLALRIGQVTGHAVAPDALVRRRRTRSLDGKSRDARFAALGGALAAHPRGGAVIRGRPVLLIDDVMTSGATLAAGTEALLAAGAAVVNVLAFARVVKDD
jgi:predicted amidophosphoribosyltransferase